MFAPKNLRITRVGANSAQTTSASKSQNARRDIKCGFRDCQKCESIISSEGIDDDLLLDSSSPTTTTTSTTKNSICLTHKSSPTIPILIPDTGSALADIAVYEHPSISNIFLLSTVISAVKEANRATHTRWMQIINDPAKNCFVFANDFHYATQCTAKTDGANAESSKQFGSRCVKTAASWLASHLNLIDVQQQQQQQQNSSSSSETKKSSSSPGPFILTNSLELYGISAEKKDDDANISEKTNNNSNSSSAPFIQTLQTFLVDHFGEDTPLLEHLTSVAGTGKEESGFQPFSVHWDRSRIDDGVKAGLLITSKLRASDSSPFYGELRGTVVALALAPLLPPGATTDGSVVLPRGIAIPGKRNMNRAFHDDVVAARLLPVSEWRPPRSFQQSNKSNKKNENAAASISVSENNNKNDYSAIDALRNGWTPTAEIVGLVNTDARRPYCGSIDSTDSNRATGTDGMLSVLFQPKASKFPKIRIQTRHIEDIRGKRLTVVVDDWAETSAYPRGHYLDVLGPIGDKDTEATVILLENDVPHYDFSAAVYDCLPKGEWHVEPQEEAVRMDLRHLNVCSVDPLGCRDIDDALHFREVEVTDNDAGEGKKLKSSSSRIEIGVHIADVTHFVKEGSAMDEEARKRCTSVYLVDRRINMLPQLLTENLCSIVGNEDRYAFSVIWQFEKEDLKNLSKPLKPCSEVFGKSIIRSRAALYYGDAQRMIDDVENDQSELSMSLRGLMDWSRRLKRDRDEEGALSLGGQEFKFVIDNDHVNPTDMKGYQKFETNSMVEEWMLYANAASARKIFDSFPSAALLRRHEPPSGDAFETLNASLVRRGIPPLVGGTSKGLNDSLNTAIDLKDKFFNNLVRILTTRCLRQAQYFSTGEIPTADLYRHFGLAMPLYTHFTSPIRRYADVVVHRQLMCAIGTAKASQVSVTENETVTQIANLINYRHEMAQKAGRDSQNLFTGFYLRNFEEGEIPIEKAYITKISDSDVYVFVTKYGQEGRVPIETLPAFYTGSSKNNKSSSSSDSTSKTNNNDTTNTNSNTNLEVFEKVTVRIRLLKEGDVMGVKLGYEIMDPEEAKKQKQQELSVKEGKEQEEVKKMNDAQLEEELNKNVEQDEEDVKGGSRRERN